MWNRTASEVEGPQVGSPRESADLLILGGGVLGLATACEVLSRGLTVILFDGAPEESATLASAGMLSPYAEQGENGSLIDLLKQARVGYPEFVSQVEAQSGCRVEMSFTGTLLVPRDGEDPSRLKNLSTRFNDMGAVAQYLYPGEVHKLEPMLAAREAGAILLEDEGYVDPVGLHTALRVCFDRLGGRWVHLPGLGFVIRSQKVVGVETETGVTMGGAVLNATGAAAERFLLPEDLARFRPRAVRGEALRLRPPSWTEGIHHVVQLPGTGYLVPRADGSVVVGATSKESGPQRKTTAGGVRSLLEAAEKVVPEAANWKFIEAWNGLRPLAGSGELILARDQRKGLFHGLGLYRHGILLAPVAATRLSKMLLDHLGRQG